MTNYNDHDDEFDFDIRTAWDAVKTQVTLGGVNAGLAGFNVGMGLVNMAAGHHALAVFNGGLVAFNVAASVSGFRDVRHVLKHLDL